MASTSRINYLSHPDILDNVVSFASDELLLSFRSVSRRYRDIVDRRLFSHVVMDLTSDGVVFIPVSRSGELISKLSRHVSYDSDPLDHALELANVIDYYGIGSWPSLSTSAIRNSVGAILRIPVIKQRLNVNLADLEVNAAVYVVNVTPGEEAEVVTEVRIECGPCAPRHVVYVLFDPTDSRLLSTSFSVTLGPPERFIKAVKDFVYLFVPREGPESLPSHRRTDSDRVSAEPDTADIAPGTGEAGPKRPESTGLDPGCDAEEDTTDKHETAHLSEDASDAMPYDDSGGGTIESWTREREDRSAEGAAGAEDLRAEELDDIEDEDLKGDIDATGSSSEAAKIAPASAKELDTRDSTDRGHAGEPSERAVKADDAIDGHGIAEEVVAEGVDKEVLEEASTMDGSESMATAEYGADDTEKPAPWAADDTTPTGGAEDTTKRSYDIVEDTEDGHVIAESDHEDKSDNDRTGSDEIDGVDTGEEVTDTGDSGGITSGEEEAEHIETDEAGSTSSEAEDDDEEPATTVLTAPGILRNFIDNMIHLPDARHTFVGLESVPRAALGIDADAEDIEPLILSALSESLKRRANQFELFGPKITLPPADSITFKTLSRYRADMKPKQWLLETAPLGRRPSPREMERASGLSVSTSESRPRKRQRRHSLEDVRDQLG